MKKNVVVIHLESMSEDIMLSELCKGNLKNVNTLIQQGVYYNNYYSTATSTIMTISDFFSGEIYACEKSKNLDDFSYCSEKGLFDVLRMNGYRTFFNIFPIFDNRYDYRDIVKIVGDETNVSQSANYDEYIEKIEAVVEDGSSPFALYVFDWRSMHAANINSSVNSMDEMAYLRFDRLDKLVGNIVDILKRHNVWDSTCIVLFGDHGDLLFPKSFNCGYTHAIEPYYNLIKTPLIIYGGNKECCKECKLVDTTDLSSIIVATLNDEKYDIKRNSVFSRNLFAQQENLLIKKGYFVTNGTYSMCVGKKGLEMYFDRYPSYRSGNLLEFFNIEFSGKITVAPKMKVEQTSHYQALVEKYYREIEESYYSLREDLEKHIDVLILQYGLKKSYRKYLNRINHSKQMQMGLIYYCFLKFVRNIIKKE